MELKDNVFGDLIYKFGWRKKEKLNLWKEFEIDCIVYCTKTEEILESQKNNYKYFNSLKNDIESILEMNSKKIGYDIEYIKNHSYPVAVIFFRDGSSGITFNCDWDMDNGFALVFTPNIKIMSQDEFL